ncbi:type II secretion system protein GspL [Ramlibacter sp. AN1015]|uniref:type II secretion system protein GspL n=1 Tax=Ramlibacter sp. AN1015 TaxID=3133428 RepID=UPI0030C34ED3
MSALYVLLPTEPISAGSEFPYLLSPDGRTVGSHASGPASMLPAPSGAGAEVVAVVPAGALSWHQVQLPRGVGPKAARLRSVLEGLLEDQLLDEPEALHFALEPDASAGASAWVAVCQRAWLRDALHALEAAGRPVSRVVPEVAPESTASLHVCGDPEAPHVLASGPQGVLILPLSSGALALAQPSEDTPVFVEPALAAAAEQLLQRPVVLQSPPQRWLQAAQSRWDLAQFEFASSGRTRALKKVGTLLGDLLHADQWRALRWGAALLVVAHLVGVNAWALKERRGLEAKQAAVRSTLTETFPQVRLVVDAPVQMEREVAALRQATGASSGRDLESMLSALAEAAGERSISGFEYEGSELRARGLGWSAGELEAAQPALRRRGLSARLDGDVVVLAQEAAR